MTSRERVVSALAKKPTDRVPIFMWFHPETTRRLARLLEIPADRVSEAMGNDIKQAWVSNNYAMEGVTHEHDGETHKDYWGIEWVKEGPFNQISRFPLAGASAEQVLDYRFPYERSGALLQQMAPVAASVGKAFIGCDVSPCIFEMYWRLRGLEAAVYEIAAEPSVAREMFRRCADFAVHLSMLACERYPLDWLWTGDDVAAQQSLIMSPSSWREMIKPELARVFAVGRSRGLPIAYHCCGAVRPIIGDLIEIGMDVLNPIQSHCPGMDPGELKREFGKSITFMGGVDTVELVPFGSPVEVRRETTRLIETMTSDGGGYILAASHTIPPETPDNNIFALFDAAGVNREEISDRASDIRNSIW